MSEADPVETLRRIISKRQTAEELFAYEEEAKKKTQVAYAEVETLIKNAAKNSVQLSKVYVVEVGGKKKAVRIVKQRGDRNGRSDDHESLKLEIMDMAE